MVVLWTWIRIRIDQILLIRIHITGCSNILWNIILFWLILSALKFCLGIPSQPIGYGDARVLLEKMGGKEVPEKWKGLLNITYRLGPGFDEKNKVSFHLSLKDKIIHYFDWSASRAERSCYSKWFLDHLSSQLVAGTSKILQICVHYY